MKKVVTVGGGTGSYTVLSGLKNIPDLSLTAIVSMADDGGSTGILRDELGVLPPGDVRQCLVALSEHSDIVRSLMSYRFEEGGLAGHSFGNIFLAALEKVTGSFAQGVGIASEILKVRGKVVPVTNARVDLHATLGDGTTVQGERMINQSDLQVGGISGIGYGEAKPTLNPHAHTAIIEADAIILGPGNFYCSLLPNLIVDGFKEAVLCSKAKLIFPVNLTNKHGHTLHFKVSDYVKSVEQHLGKKVEVVLVNTEKPSAEQIEMYKMEEGDGVLVEDDMGEDPRVLRTDLLSHAIPHVPVAERAIRGLIRHDKDKLASAIASVI